MKKIAIDCLGGDLGSEPIIKGVALALEEFEFEATLVGISDEIKKCLPAKFLQKVTIIETNDFIKMEESATDALKRKDSSIFKAIELLKEKKVDALVSAGHSGATMSLATLRVGRIKGVNRPAIAAFLPRIDDKICLLLDAGANVDCKADHFYQFAIMGKAYYESIFEEKLPRVGLISNGEEEGKGNGQTKEAFDLMSNIDGFIGYVEGNNLFDGSVDVAVCDGFVGNVVLKTSEGAGNFLKHFFKNHINDSMFLRIGAFFMKSLFEKLKKRIDYAEYGGAPLLGIDGHVIICHGKSNAKAIKNGIRQAIAFANSNVNNHIQKTLQISQKSN